MLIGMTLKVIQQGECGVDGQTRCVCGADMGKLGSKILLPCKQTLVLDV